MILRVQGMSKFLVTKLLVLLVSIVFLVNGNVFANEMVSSEAFLKLEKAAAGITYTSDKRLFITYHPFYNPKIKIVERTADGDLVPFPNDAMQTAYDTEGQLKNSDEYFNWVLSTRSDGNGILWILDSGQNEPRIPPKLVAWDLNTNQRKKVIELPKGVTLPESQHNDFAISTKHNLIVIADEGIARGPIGNKAALVVVNTQTGESRRILQGSSLVAPNLDMPMLMDKGTQYEKSVDLFIGVDGVVIDKEENLLYFTTVSGTKVYRIRMSDLADFSQSNKVLTSKAEVYAEKPMNGGLTIDSDNNLYLCEIGTRTIGIIPANTRQYRAYTTNENMVWPDGINAGPDGYLYTSAAQVSFAGAFNAGKQINKAPYIIYRFKPLASPLLGR